MHFRLPHGGLAAGAVAVEPLVAPLPDCQPRHPRCNMIPADNGGQRFFEPFLRVHLSVKVARVLLARIVNVASSPTGDLPRKG